MSRLPLTDQPQPDESLDSWLEYLATRLGLEVAELLIACGIVTAQRAGFTAGVNDDFALKLSAATGAPISTIRNATTRRFLSAPGGATGRLEALLVEGRATRYCPECLRTEFPRWKLLWHLRTTLICVQHQCVLIAVCPKCGGRPRLNRSGGAQTLHTLNERKYSCSSPGCLPALRSEVAPSVKEAPSVLRAQEWIDSLLESGYYSLPSLPETSDESLSILRDVAEITARHVSASDWGLEAQLCPSPSVRRTEEEICQVDTPRWPLRENLIAQTHLFRAYTAKAPRLARDHLSFLHPAVASMLCSRPPESDRKSLACMTTRRLLYPYLLRWGPANRPWTPELMRTASVAPIPSRYLPSRCWPAMVDIAPSMTPRAAPILPLTSCVVLGMLGHDASSRQIARQLGLVLPDILVERELWDVFRGSDLEAVLDHFVSLHSHLRRNPPPIDYDRRRALFPSPSTLYGNPRRRTPAHRYVWQLLTGGDPFAVSGTASRFGPVIATYEAFVRGLTQNQMRVLRDEATRLLAVQGIRDEPLLYGPLIGPRGLRVPTADELRWLPVTTLLLPGTHVTELKSPHRYFDPGDVVARALDGDERLAKILVCFRVAVTQPERIRGEPLTEVVDEIESYLEDMLGRRLSVEGRTRLTEAGRQLVEEVGRHAVALDGREYDPLDGTH